MNIEMQGFTQKVISTRFLYFYAGFFFLTSKNYQKNPDLHDIHSSTEHNMTRDHVLFRYGSL